MDDTLLIRQRRITHRLRDLSPGGLYDLLLEQVGTLECSPLFQQIAPAEAQALVGDLVKLQTHFMHLSDLFVACTGGNAADQADALPQGQLLDLFLAAAADEREEQAFFERLTSYERASFAYTLLVMQAVLEDYRGLVSVALGGLQAPIAPGAFARHPASQAAGTVEGWDEQAGTATLRLQPGGENAPPMTAIYPVGELTVTGRAFPQPDAYWVGLRLARVSPGQYFKLIDKAYEDRALWAYRWIYDPRARRAFGLALVSRQHELASSQDAWVALSLASILNRVASAHPLEVYCAPRAYKGPSFFTTGARRRPDPTGAPAEGGPPPETQIAINDLGLPELSFSGARESSDQAREGGTMLSELELATVLGEGEADPQAYRIQASHLVYTAAGELRDCYAEVVFRSAVCTIRSMDQWNELKARALHLKESAHPSSW